MMTSHNQLVVNALQHHQLQQAEETEWNKTVVNVYLAAIHQFDKTDQHPIPMEFAAALYATFYAGNFHIDKGNRLASPCITSELMANWLAFRSCQ